MITAFQIAIGIWFGGLFLVGTVWGVMELAEKIAQSRRYGRPWHRWLAR